jgi:predicted lipoprotein with Yx(FWY)xxD motif
MRKLTTTSIPALVALALLGGCGSSSNGKTSAETATQAPSSSGGSAATVKTASNSSLGGTVLVDASGMTLYSLSGESAGKFICSTSACEAIWHPLVATGSTPTGVESLGTVKRPDGQEQVAYKGMPLYTFAQDAKPGDAKGQGIKDVGTWSAIVIGSSAGTPTTTTNKPYSGGGGVY